MGIRRYIASRILQTIFTLWAFFTILFVLFRVVPGNPATMYVVSGMNQEQRQAMLERLGLNRPMHVQYLDYVTDLLQLDLGQSYTFNMPVADLLWQRFINTFVLMAPALFTAFALAIVIGSLLGWYRGSKLEKVGIIGSLVTRSTPSFFVGLLLLIVFTFTLGWTPSGGMLSPGSVSGNNPGISKFMSVDFLRHAVLPFVTATIVWFATPVLLMRNSMLEMITSNFINIKKAEGFPEHVLIYKHAVRNSILPLVTEAAVTVGFAFGGSVVIETVFNWPGMGSTMVTALFDRDYPVAQGAFFLMGTIVILMNFVADMLYMVLDPRVGYE
jgi:peptide/nickel transport system permease protein